MVASVPSRQSVRRAGSVGGVGSCGVLGDRASPGSRTPLYATHLGTPARPIGLVAVKITGIGVKLPSRLDERWREASADGSAYQVRCCGALAGVAALCLGFDRGEGLGDHLLPTVGD